MNKWQIEELLSQNTRLNLLAKLRQEFETSEEAANFFNINLENSYVELIHYLMGK